MFFMQKNKTPLYDLRKKAGLTLQQLADLLHTSKSQVSNLENGHRKLAPEWLERLSKVLNCTKAELLGEAPTDQLTDREKMLLDYFRKSDAAGQDLMLRTGDTVAKLSSKIEKSSLNEAG